MWRSLIVSIPMSLVITGALASILVDGKATVLSGDDLTIDGTPFHLATIDSFELNQQCWDGATVIDCGGRASESRCHAQGDVIKFASPPETAARRAPGHVEPGLFVSA